MSWAPGPSSITASLLSRFLGSVARATFLFWVSLHKRRDSWELTLPLLQVPLPLASRPCLSLLVLHSCRLNSSDPPRSCRRTETVSNSTGKVTFTFFSSHGRSHFWVSRFTDFLIRTQATLDPGTGGQAPGPGRAPGREDGWREQRLRCQVSLSPCNFLSGYIAALASVVRHSSKPFP